MFRHPSKSYRSKHSKQKDAILVKPKLVAEIDDWEKQLFAQNNVRIEEDVFTSPRTKNLSLFDKINIYYAKIFKTSTFAMVSTKSTCNIDTKSIQSVLR